MEGQDAFQIGDETNKASLAKSRIYHYFEDQMNNEQFLRTLYILVRQSGIASNEAMVHEIASELLNDVVEEALTHSDRYDTFTRALVIWCRPKCCQTKEGETYSICAERSFSLPI